MRFIPRSSSRGDNVSMRVLVVEDEPKMAELLARGLREEGHAADVAGRGEDALWMARAVAYDAIVLDVMLPGHRRVRDLPRAARRRGLDAGADADRARRGRGPDRGPRRRRRRLPAEAVLVRRAARAAARACPPGAGRAAGRRSRSATLRLDPATRRAWRGETELELSAKEFALLEAFMRRPGEVLSRGPAARSSVGHRRSRAARTSSTSTSATLREKIDRPFGDAIETVRGVGYRLRADGG